MCCVLICNYEFINFMILKMYLNRLMDSLLYSYSKKIKKYITIPVATFKHLIYFILNL